MKNDNIEPKQQDTNTAPVIPNLSKEELYTEIVSLQDRVVQLETLMNRVVRHLNNHTPGNDLGSMEKGSEIKVAVRPKRLPKKFIDPESDPLFRKTLQRLTKEEREVFVEKKRQIGECKIRLFDYLCIEKRVKHKFVKEGRYADRYPKRVIKIALNELAHEGLILIEYEMIDGERVAFVKIKED